MRTTEPRIAPLPESEWTPEQHELMAPLKARGTDYAIFRTMIRHPAAFRAFMAWGNHILSKSNTLPPREREIAILRTGYLCKSGYEWAQHVLIGRRVGLTDAEIAAIKVGPSDPSWSEPDAAILQAVDELQQDRFVADASWARLAAHFDEPQRMDLVFTVGQYTQVSMLLNSFGVQLDDNLAPDPDLRA